MGVIIQEKNTLLFQSEGTFFHTTNVVITLYYNSVFVNQCICIQHSA